MFGGNRGRSRGSDQKWLIPKLVPRAPDPRNGPDVQNGKGPSERHFVIVRKWTASRSRPNLYHLSIRSRVSGRQRGRLPFC